LVSKSIVQSVEAIHELPLHFVLNAYFLSFQKLKQTEAYAFLNLPPLALSE